MKPLLLVLVASVALAQPPRPNLINAKFESRAFSGDLAAQIRAQRRHGSATPSRPRAAIIRVAAGAGQTCPAAGWRVVREPQSNGQVSKHCYFTRRNGYAGGLISRRKQSIEKVHVYSLGLPAGRRRASLCVVDGRAGAASVSYLEKLITSSASDRHLDGALFAISQHDVPQGLDALIRLAKNDPSAHIRGQALFWLAQKAGQRASATIQNAIENDPDTGVKKRAVFALSQLPKDEAVPKLIEIARNQKNREVQKQAFFWLGQTHDPRALAFFEQVLTK